MKDFLFFGLPLILSVAIAIFLYVTGPVTVFGGAMVGVLLLVVGGILWIVKEVKYSKEYKRVNKEYDQYETEAEQALASEIDAVKGNSLKKKLVKRRLVREYIEKNYPEASRNVSDSKFDNWYGWLNAFSIIGWGFFSPMFGVLAVVVVALLIDYVIGSDSFLYHISPSYYVVANAVFAIVAAATTIWKRYYILTFVAATIASISVFGIFTVGPDNILQLAYRMMIECVDSNFLYYDYGLAKARMFCSFLLVTMFSFCLMVYPFIKNWAIGLWLCVLIIYVCFPINMASITWKLYMIRTAIVADIAAMSGMSYAATHMLLFVYMLSLLPVLSAQPAFFRAWRACRQQDEKTRANKQYTEKCERVFRKCMIWLIINIVAMALLWSRFFGFSLTDAQMIIENDCEKIANFTGVYYKLVYLIVLVVLPLLSIIASRILYNYTKKQIK